MRCVNLQGTLSFIIKTINLEGTTGLKRKKNAFFAFYFLQTPEKACMKVLTKQKQQTEQYLLQILSQEFCGFLYMFFHRTG